jgi:hypothetical protein
VLLYTTYRYCVKTADTGTTVWTHILQMARQGVHHKGTQSLFIRGKAWEIFMMSMRWHTLRSWNADKGKVSRFVINHMNSIFFCNLLYSKISWTKRRRILIDFKLHLLKVIPKWPIFNLKIRKFYFYFIIIFTEYAHLEYIFWKFAENTVFYIHKAHIVLRRIKN